MLEVIKQCIRREQAAGHEEAVDILIDLGAELLEIADSYRV